MCWNWEGKRSQYNYIGNLLRELESELMDASIHAIKDGDWSRGFVVRRKRLFGDENEKSEESEYDVEEEVPEIPITVWLLSNENTFSSA